MQTGGSSRGIHDTRSGLANIGMVSRALKAKETDLQAHTIAWDGITLITHSSNPVKALSNAQIKAIYTGNINNWREVGGTDHYIVVVNKAEGRSTLDLFLRYFQLNNTEVNADIIIGDNQQGLKIVEGNPHAIAYISIGAAAFEVRQGTPINLLSINGIAATLANVEKGTFPIARPLNLITTINNSNGSSSLTQRFINFAQSEHVQDLVTQQFFIPASMSPKLATSP